MNLAALGLGFAAGRYLLRRLLGSLTKSTRPPIVRRPREPLPPCDECDGGGIVPDPYDPTPCGGCPAGEAWTTAFADLMTDPNHPEEH